MAEPVWTPPNLSQLCPAQTQLSACSAFAHVYLDLLVLLYGASRDQQPASAGDGESYDFIVVGAGSAGCVVANRLSAIAEWKVLLLEAGPEEPEITGVPALCTTLLNTNIDWQYKTMPSQNACLAYPEQRCAWPRGKTMGGSSSINSMAYVRGNRYDYDSWAALGNIGWSFKDVLPYFKKSERNLNIETLNPEYHGVDGEQSVSWYPYVDMPSLKFTEALNESGVPLRDSNAALQFGTQQVQSTSEQGQRVSTNKAFIRPIRYKRKNLTVRPESEVIKIIFDENKKASGVKYLKNGNEFTAYATKEVIISGGSINSPKLLMLSGIGPKDHLEDLQIPVIEDLPVGRNLHDHVSLNGILIALPNETATTVSREEMLIDVLEYKQMELKRGPLSANGPVSTVAFYKTDGMQPAPDLQVEMKSVSWREYIREPVAYDRLTIFPSAFYDAVVPKVMNIAPYSRGKLLLNASDPYGDPLIWPGYFEDPRDLVRLVKGVKLLLTMEDAPAFKSLGAYFVKTSLPACQHLAWGTDAYFECQAISYTSSPYHPVGSCKMGPKEDPTAVVDPRLRVYGVAGLRVIDASIMPQVPRGNTNAPSQMVGERGSAFILEDWLQS